jgi:hypothetical protein
MKSGWNVLVGTIAGIQPGLALSAGGAWPGLEDNDPSRTLRPQRDTQRQRHLSAPAWQRWLPWHNFTRVIEFTLNDVYPPMDTTGWLKSGPYCVRKTLLGPESMKNPNPNPGQSHEGHHIQLGKSTDAVRRR